MKTEAEAGLGRAMQASEKASGTRGQLTGPGVIGGSARSRQQKTVSTYAKQGINKRLATQARRMGALSGPEVNAVAARDKTLATIKGSDNHLDEKLRQALPWTRSAPDSGAR